MILMTVLNKTNYLHFWLMKNRIERFFLNCLLFITNVLLYFINGMIKIKKGGK